MNIGIEMKIETATKATDVVLKISPMELRMSPSIIRLLSAVNMEFANSSASVSISTLPVEAVVLSRVDELQDRTEGSSLTPKLRSFPQYWKPRRFDQKKYWFFLAPTAEEACEDNIDDAADKAVMKRAPIEHAHVEMERINFTLESGDSSVCFVSRKVCTTTFCYLFLHRCPYRSSSCKYL
ncbi:unnamed protein product [Cylicostephanus goldi]|uniref:Uncharacterized protein n=1 Tax=Cylicostephanus goldi TaxID=71465 RepID=A0A3P6UYZ5_CYLGO|nr:unnamed protein product [Cylicostephanus goldi]